MSGATDLAGMDYDFGERETLQVDYENIEVGAALS